MLQPDYIPEETKYLLNIKKEKVLKIRGVKLKCEILKTVKAEKNLTIRVIQLRKEKILTKWPKPIELLHIIVGKRG